MLLKNKYKELKTFLKSSDILAEEEECYCYAEDASNIAQPKATPAVVVFAKSIEDVQNIIKYANAHDIPIIPRGAGTNMVGSCVCENSGSIVLNFAKMNNIIEIDSVNMTAKVEPGVIVGDLKSEAEKRGLFFPPDPSNYAVSTIGGAISQSSGGALSFKYGTTKDYVLSLKVVTADGRLMTLGAETSKDSTGYHLAQLMVGSEGTLAIVVEATLKLIPKPESMCALSAYFDDFAKGISVVNTIIENKIYPAAIDFMDKNAINTVEDFAQCGLNRNKDCMLLIALDGVSEIIEDQAQKLSDLLYEFDATDVKFSKNSDEYDKIWNARRASFAATTRLAPDVVSDDIIVPRRNLAIMAEKCQNIAEKYKLKMCLIGHAGDGNIHPQIALNLSNDDEFKNYMNARAEMYEEAMKLNGTISAEHGIGLEKKAFLSNIVDENAIEYMRLIKKVFDPKNILNPNKIF